MASGRRQARQAYDAQVGTDDNFADIGAKGHDKEKLQKLVDLNNLVCLDVEQYPETIAASVTSGTSSRDLRAALAAVAVATSAYLPPSGGIGADLYQRVHVQRPEQEREQLRARVHPRRLGVAKHSPRRTCALLQWTAPETER